MDRKLLVFALVFAGCSSNGAPNPGQIPTMLPSDSGGGSSVMSDTGLPDTGFVVTPDSGATDSGMVQSDANTGIDADIDAGIDSGGHDAGDAGTDSSTDAGVDSGGDAATDAETDAQVADCSDGQTRCVGVDAQSCFNGTWTTQASCQYACSDGACTGVCTPGDTDCSNPQNPQTCNAQNQWEASGSCQVCTPGSKDCQGDVPRTCNDEGQWVNGTTCDFVCSAGSCIGSCDPGSKQCSGDTPQTCDSNGNWTSGSDCQYVCSSGSCTGTCTPGAQRCSGDSAQTCNGAGQWVTDEVCPYVCTGNGTCSGVCEPGSADCQGDTPRTCNVQGQWDTQPACQYVCSAGSCSGVCEPGSTRCSGVQIQTCNALGYWATAPSDCPAVAGADSYCMADVCTFDCQLDYDDCDGNPSNGCEVHLEDDSNNCGACGHSCCGGACGGGTCEVADLAPNGSSAFDVDSENLYYIYAGGLHKQPRDGSTETTIATEPDSSSKLSDVATNGIDVVWGIQGRYYGLGDPDNRTLYIRSQSVDGGTVSTLHQCVQCTAYPVNIAFDDTTVYWQYSASHQWRGRLGSGEPIRYPSGNVSTANTVNTPNGGFSQIVDFVSGGTTLYGIKSESDSTIDTTVPGSGIEQEFMDFPSTANGAVVASPVSDNTYLYFLGYDPEDFTKMGVWRKPLAGESLQQIVEDTSIDFTNIATDGTYVYYGSNDELVRVPVGSGVPESIAPLAGGIDRIRIANECVYWHDGQGIHAKAVNP